MKWINFLYQHEHFDLLPQQKPLHMYLTQQSHRILHRYEAQPELVLIVCILIACLLIVAFIYVCLQLRAMLWTRSIKTTNRSLLLAKSNKKSNSKSDLKKKKNELQRKYYESWTENTSDDEQKIKHRKSGKDVELIERGKLKINRKKEDDLNRLRKQALEKKEEKMLKKERKKQKLSDSEKEISDRESEMNQSVRFDWHRNDQLLSNSCHCGCYHCCSNRYDLKKYKKTPNIQDRYTKLKRSKRKSPSSSSSSSSPSSPSSSSSLDSYESKKKKCAKKSKSNVQNDKYYSLRSYLAKMSKDASRSDLVANSKPKSWSSHAHLSRPQLSRCHFDNSS